jgi:hypothetical protein
MKTDGHSPVKFLCNNGEVYFCKYRTALDRQEMNCLAYEFVCSRLLEKLNLATPSTELISIGVGSLDAKKIKKNKYLREGHRCFGSKEVKNSMVLNAFSVVETKKEFNRILNPNDIIRIAIFDLWVDNVDRGRSFGEGHNYNLLIEQVGNKEQILAFDHGFTFGGINQIGIFNPNIPIQEENKFHKSPYYKSVVRFIPRSTCLKIANDFVNLLSENYAEDIKNSLVSLPQEWELTPNLDGRMIDFLSNQERLEQIRQIIIK